VKIPCPPRKFRCLPSGAGPCWWSLCGGEWSPARESVWREDDTQCSDRDRGYEGTFKLAFLEHRAVVPALGFYQWQVGGDCKQPLRPSRKATRMVCGCQWRSSLSTLTCPTGGHDRMLAFVLPEAVDDVNTD